MKLILKAIFLLAIFTINTSNAQENFKGKIVDIESGAALTNVSITNLTDNQIYTSNIQGEFEVNSSGIYLIQKTGYHPTELTIDQKYQIIQLEIDISELNEVVINANQLPKRLKKATNTVNIVSTEDIQKANNTIIAPTLNRIPGVFMQSATLSTNRITIRGVGARNLFGTAKIRAYFKDIPLTNGSGETNIEDFELTSIARLEIDKGASTIYGVGLGGTIHLTPQNAYLNQANANGEFMFGSFGLIKETVNLNYGSTKNSFRAIYSNTHSDGYRDNNEYDRQTFTLSTNHFLGENDELSFLMSYVDLFGYIPSSINENAYINNPSSAAFTWRQAKGYEDSQRAIFGLSWNHRYNDNLKQSTSIFSSFRNGYEPRPFDILDEKTFAIGLRSRLIGNTNIFDKTLDWTLGGEIFRDNYRYGTFENLYEDYPPGTGSVEGGPLTDFKEKRSYFNLFFESNYALTEKTTLSLGLNYNQTSYDLDDRFMASASDPDQSGSYKFNGILSPKFGISHLFADNISVYSNISHGFSPITLDETLMPDGQINQDLKPETGWNFEVGTRGSLIQNKLFFNLSLYRLDIKNLLVSRRTAQDQYIGINAGRTQHDGIEASLNYNILNKESFKLSTFASYTLNNYKFKEFVDDTNDYSGNDLTGVPSDVFNAGIDFSSKIGFYGNINFQYVGSMPILDDNSLYSDSYKLTNLKVGYKINFIDNKLTCNAFYGLNNIFDEKYASQILINTSGFGGSAPRYYYPGEPVNYFAGININYNF
ncbi:TonB-dependent receptor [Flavobacteriaceae bacterium XHP0103]|uniref:TonB-dependent receptor domain-containing protein n=1 Tax=Marixanthotalea marina TaxID=2844359 RepID=UPI002989A39C|nr:TonB-dependent receptor [Marixanthotalea marina]MBU3822651.1 TonB-dependent receptor [Marixanthotalea marina]